MSKKQKMVCLCLVLFSFFSVIFNYHEKKISSTVSLAYQDPSLTLNTTTTAPQTLVSTTTLPVNEPKPTTLQFFGDIMLDRNVAKNMSAQGLDYIFANIKDHPETLFPPSDLLVANLEGAFAPKRVPTTKSIAFRFDPKLANDLARWGFDVVSLANNHSLDMGRTNTDFTRETLKKVRIGYFGDQTREGAQYSYATTTQNGLKFAFIGLNNTDHPLNMPQVVAAIQQAKQQADYVIAVMHWGVEYQALSHPTQRDLAHRLINSGVDAVIGSHPHVVEEAEIYKDKPIFYSLGNFIFDQYFSTETQQGLSVIFRFSGKKLTTIDLLPFYGKNSQVMVMTEKQKNDFFSTFIKNSRLADKKIINNQIAF